MKRRPIDPRIEPGRLPVDPHGSGAGEGVPAETFREALSHWASGVSLVAVRDPDDGQVHGTTVSAFGGVSAAPPRIVVSLGPGAQILPFLEEGRRFVVNILSEEQRRIASVFSDPFPVGPSPFPAEGDPVIAGSLVALHCTVEGLVAVESSRLVLGRVMQVADTEADEGAPLLYYRRTYRTLAEP